MASWSVADAKARLSEVMERARREGPQEISRHGRPAVIVVAIEEWEAKSRRKGSLAEFFLTSPLRGVDLDLDRRDDEPRDTPLPDAT